MMYKAWCSIEKVSYYFSRSSIKFQGHTGWKIDDLDQIRARLLGPSQLSNASDLPCWWKLHHWLHCKLSKWQCLMQPVMTNFIRMTTFPFQWCFHYLHLSHQSPFANGLPLQAHHSGTLFTYCVPFICSTFQPHLTPLLSRPSNRGILHYKDAILSVYRRSHFGDYRTFLLNTLRPRQNGCHFADDTFNRIFVNENVRISIKFLLKLVPKGPINNNPAFVQIMAWRRSGDKPLSEPMMISLLTHLCVTQPQWVKLHAL